MPCSHFSKNFWLSQLPAIEEVKIIIIEQTQGQIGDAYLVPPLYSIGILLARIFDRFSLRGKQGFQFVCLLPAAP